MTKLKLNINCHNYAFIGPWISDRSCVYGLQAFPHSCCSDHDDQLVTGWLLCQEPSCMDPVGTVSLLPNLLF